MGAVGLMKAVGLTKVLFIVIPLVIMLRFPFIQDLTINSATYQDGQLIISGSMKVLLTDEAWTEFGYKDGNFYWFNEWWQTEAPGMTKGPFRLVSVTWTLIEHTEVYDKLGFTMVLERRCAHSKKAHILLGIVESDGALSDASGLKVCGAKSFFRRNNVNIVLCAYLSEEGGFGVSNECDLMEGI